MFDQQLFSTLWKSKSKALNAWSLRALCAFPNISVKLVASSPYKSICFWYASPSTNVTKFRRWSNLQSIVIKKKSKKLYFSRENVTEFRQYYLKRKNLVELVLEATVIVVIITTMIPQNPIFGELTILRVKQCTQWRRESDWKIFS